MTRWKQPSLMAEVGQDNPSRKCRIGYKFCCRWELNHEMTERPQASSSMKSWAVRCSTGRWPGTPADSLLPVTTHSGHMAWAVALSGRLSTQAPLPVRKQHFQVLTFSKGNSWDHFFQCTSVASPSVQATCGQVQLYREPAAGAQPCASSPRIQCWVPTAHPWAQPSLYTWDTWVWIWFQAPLAWETFGPYWPSIKLWFTKNPTLLYT